MSHAREAGTRGPGSDSVNEKVFVPVSDIQGDKPSTTVGVTSPSGPDLVGHQVGVYQVVERLGTGGMGEVYRGRHERLKRFVALKVLPPAWTDHHESRRRLLREARAASALNHPNIVTVHDLLTEGERIVIVMELIEGPTLREILEQGPLPVPTALRYGLQIADALATAHEAGIVHRDLKPSNIMVVGRHRVKLLDFGLAKHVATAGKGAEVSSRMTRLGTIMGTAPYMSPEQARGEIVGPDSDIFSFGTVLYEMLAGKRPFAGGDRVQLLHAICEGEAAPVLEVRPEVEISLSDLVQSLLAKRASDRLRPMSRVRDSLETLAPSVAMESIGPVGGEVEGGRAWRSWQLAVGLLALLALSFFVGREVLDRLRGDEAGRASTAVSDGLVPYDLLSEGNAALARDDRPGNLDRAISAFEQAIKLDATYAPAHARLALAFRQKYLAGGGDPVWLDRAGDAARMAVRLDQHLASARTALGVVLTDLGEYEGAKQQLEQALVLQPLGPRVHGAMAALRWASGDHEKARDLYEAAVALDPDDWHLWSEYGTILYAQADLEGAKRCFEKVADLTPDNYVAYQSLAAVHHQEGRVDEAAKQLQLALEIHPDADVYSNLGTWLYFQGRYVEAVDAFERAIELKPRAQFFGNLGDANRWIVGAEEEAQAAFLRAAQMVRDALDADPGNSNLRAQYGEYLAKKGDAPESRKQMSRVGDAAEMTARSWFRATLAYEILGERVAALQALARSLEKGYSLIEVEKEPELLGLREDVRFHRLAAQFDE